MERPQILEGPWFPWPPISAAYEGEEDKPDPYSHVVRSIIRKQNT